MNLWQKDEAVKRFVFEQQFAQVAADLLGVEKVRLYHDQALFKEPGGGHTPWHQDKGVAPASGDGVVVQKNLILKGLPPRQSKRLTLLLR